MAAHVPVRGVRNFARAEHSMLCECGRTRFIWIADNGAAKATTGKYLFVDRTRRQSFPLAVHASSLSLIRDHLRSATCQTEPVKHEHTDLTIPYSYIFRCGLFWAWVSLTLPVLRRKVRLLARLTFNRNNKEYLIPGFECYPEKGAVLKCRSYQRNGTWGNGPG